MAISGSDFFKKELTAYGVRIVAAGDVGGQAAIPDAFIEKVAQTFKLLLNKDGPNINSAAQIATINTLSGAVGTYHAGLPTIQRIARGAGADYSTNFLTDDGIVFWNLTDFFDSTVQNDMVWYLNSTGEVTGDGDTDAQEVLEHVMHTLHMHGLNARGLKLYPQLDADWATGDLYLAMVEAYDGGFWSSEGYGGDAWKTDGEAFEVAAKEYLYLLNFCMFDYSELWTGGSLAPEWADSVKTSAGIQANLPLGYALYNTYIAPSISKIPLATIRSIFQDGDVGDPTVAGASGYTVDISGAAQVLENSWNSNYWKLWLPGLDFDGVYDVNTIYQPGDVVQYGGYLFQSKLINNIGNKPSTTYGDDSTDAWELITTAYDMEGAFDDATEYKVGSIVTYGGDLYVALTDSTGQRPGNFVVQAPYEAEDSAGTRIQVNLQDSVAAGAITVGMRVSGEGFARGQMVESISVDNDSSTASQIATIILNEEPDGTISDSAILTFTGSNYEYWELLIPGANYEGKWQSGRLYNIDDIAYIGKATYRCIREHTSALVSQPDNDLQNVYWVIYLPHDPRNSLTNPGEIVYRTANGNEALSIGNQATILKVVDGLPAWSSIDFTPNLYYVATNGLDTPTRGTTPDTAFKTVRYACELVKNGLKQQNARILLENNKEWIVQETFYWFLYQQNNLISPFDASYNFDNAKVLRDCRFIVDGVIKDLIRGGNSQTVSNALSYFDLESTNKFTTQLVEEQSLYFQAFFVQLFNNIESALTNVAPSTNYQQEELNRLGEDADPEDVPTPQITQYFNSNLTLESDTLTFVGALERIILESFAAGSPDSIPAANQAAYSTIIIKAGTYLEQLPIVVPCNTALNGDELRGTTIQPADPVNTLCTRTIGDVNLFEVGSTVNMVHNTPVQFVSLNPIDEISTVIGDVTAGKTYYVIGSSITSNRFSVSETKDGPAHELLTNIGGMYVYGGNALENMFLVQNATGIRNMTVKGLRGTLTDENEYLTRRPTGGAYVSLDPGTGPDDTSAWITYKSPYVQNVTTFGKGCIGLKIDSDLHNGGNHSVVSNDFTQVISDGIGIWCKGGEALTEAVSVFSYYNYAGYFAEAGAKIRATNGNSSYGTFGVVAEGFDIAETPATGLVNNTSGEATAEAVSALGANAEILKIQYTHAGEDYYTSTTNLLNYSNDILNTDNWLTDSNVSIVRAPTTPYDGEFAWKVTSNTSLSDDAFLYQDIDVSPQGRIYTDVAGVNLDGSGIDATFDVTVSANSYEVVVNDGGSGYVIGNQIQLSGKSFGGRSPENDITVTVDSLSITSILTVTFTGTVPTGSALPYNVSIHAKKGNSSYIDLYTVFSGTTELQNYVRFNFDTEAITTSIVGGAANSPTNLRADFLDDGWWRISYTVYDENGRNNSLRYKLYPRGIDGLEGFTYFYGAQVTIGADPTFFLETTDNTPSAFANIKITGAGTGLKVIGDEIRTGAVFQARLLENENVRLGGLGYKIQTNNAQAGTTDYLTLAQSEVATAAEYEGMRIVVSSGKGAGQYGIISSYTPINKRASIVKESFEEQEVVSTSSSDNRITLSDSADSHQLYAGQKITFAPTYYDIDVSSASQSSLNVLGTLGNLNNYIYVSSTDRLRVNQKINFSGTTFGGVITGFDYYIIDVLDDRSIQISTSLGGAVWPVSNVNIDDPDDSPIVLTNEVEPFLLNYPDDTSYLTANTTASMEVTLPIQFTGTALGDIELGDIYYIQEIFNGTQFSISESQLSIAITGTSAVNNGLTTADTSGLDPLTPIIFKGTTIGGIVEKTKYYVNSIIDGITFSLSSGIVQTTATGTEGVSNLITVTSTAGFTAGSPIQFTGVDFGGIDNDQIYYIQVVNDATTFTISETPGGAAVPLTTQVGEIITRTVSDEVTLTTQTGSFTAVTTGDKFIVEADRDNMEGSFYTEIFGNVVAGNYYYIKEIFENSDLEITICETLGGSVFPLETEDGSMQINSVGWDHINAGTPLVSTFDSTSVYQIEPRISFPRPPFDAELLPEIPNPVADGHCTIVSDSFRLLAIPSLGDRVKSTSDYINWDQEYILPVNGQEITNGGWADAAFGNKTYVIISKTGEDTLYSASDGLTWLSVDLPTLPTPSPGEDQPYWKAVAYGNGRFVAVAQHAETSAYSTNNGGTWTEVTGPIGPDEDWTDVAYGNETFVAISRSSSTAKYSIDGGETWVATDLLAGDGSTIDNWSKIQFGNGRFVVVSSEERTSLYSFDGITWYSSNTEVSGDLMKYGQGVFIVINNDTGLCCISPDGYNWFLETELVGGDYGSVGFGIDSITDIGYFMTISPTGDEAYKVSAGCRAIARAGVASSSLDAISLLEPGSGYLDDSFVPTVKITDPNNSEEALVQVRVGNGSLGAPTFVDFGSGFNTTSTAISIRGAGFSDAFQTGLRFIASDVTRFPSPGDNLQFEGNDIIYRVAKATALKGSVVPNLEATIQLSPQLTQETSPTDNTSFTIRSKFSQCRITNHDFLNIGFGNQVQSNYPGLPEDTNLEPQDEVVEANNGRVFYSSTDQDGNFRVGDLFAVEQATGVVTLSAEEFGLEGLTEITIGGVALGGSPVTVSEFSTDGTFVANSNNIVPTQKAIKTYLASRLSQGGSDTFTGLLQAGTVKVGGPDEITSSVVEGGEGWQVKMGVKVNLEGPTAAWGGDGIAMAYFMKTFVDPTR